MSLEVITDPQVIREAMGDTVDAASMLREDKRVRVVHYSGGWAVMRGREVIAGHRFVTTAILHQMQLEGRL